MLAAQMAAEVRSPTPICLNLWPRCTLTVCSLMPSARPICHPVHDRRGQIHQHHIGGHLGGQLNRLGAVGRLPHHLQVLSRVHWLSLSLAVAIAH